MDVLISGNLSGGCTVYKANVGAYNPHSGLWGTYCGFVAFANDGNMYAVGDSNDLPGTRVLLMSYESDRWYRISCDYDLERHVMDVRVDGDLKAMSAPFTSSVAPSGIVLVAGHATNPLLWVDNIDITSVVPPDLLIDIRVASVDIRWHGLPDTLYQVQYRSGLTGGGWEDLLPAPVVGTGTNVVNDVARDNERRFYHIIRVEQ